MDKIRKLADYLVRNKVDAILFAEALTLVQDEVVKRVLAKNIESGHSIKDPLPLAKSNSKNRSAIYDIPLSHGARMFFSSFDTKAAVEVWNLVETLRDKWEELNHLLYKFNMP